MEMWMMIAIGVGLLLLAYLFMGKKSPQMECVDGVCFPPTPTPEEAEMITKETSLHPPVNPETMSAATGEMVCEGDKCMMKPKTE
jgi:hypothetical protein